ncbi:MAG: FHA domain-containing protein, partial [Alphaproteobacteria bacterium]
DGLVIGRKETLVDQPIADRSVSRRHVRVTMLGQEIGIVDLNSTHGTKIDGRKLKPFADPEPLRSGAQLTLGGVTLKVSRR